MSSQIVTCLIKSVAYCKQIIFFKVANERGEGWPGAGSGAGVGKG